MFFRRYLLDPLLRLAVVATVYLMAGSVFGVAVGFVAAAVIGVVVYLVLARRMLVRHRVLGGAGGRVSVPMRLLLAAIPTGMTISLLWVVLGPLPTAVLGVQGDSTEVAYLRATLIIANLPITVSAALQTMFQAAATRLWRAQRLDELAAAYWRTGLWTALITLPVLMLSPRVCRAHSRHTVRRGIPISSVAADAALWWSVAGCAARPIAKPGVGDQQ